MKLIRLTALIAVLMTAIACDTKETHKEIQISELKLPQSGIVQDDQSFYLEEELRNNEYQSDTVQQPLKPGQKKQFQQAPPIQPDWDKKIIKTAKLNVEVKDFEK